MDVGGNGRLRFGDFEFDSTSVKLFRRDRPVKVQPQPLRVLAVLLEKAGEIVPREHLRARVWGDATFVEFDQGLNYCIRQIRRALHDGASEPLYIETLPKQGYRFIAPVVVAAGGPEPSVANKASVEPATPDGIVTEAIADPPEPTPPDAVLSSPALPARHMPVSLLALGLLAVLALGGVAVYSALRLHPAGVRYTQLTDFTDSALAPAVSPDGRMVAFIRGGKSFLTADQIYVKVLPNGEAKRLTDDPRRKYNLAFTPDGTQIAYTVMQFPTWATYTVSVLGGDSHLFLNNAAGLTWLDGRQVLFSRIRSGQHMGIATGAATGQDFRDLYFPSHERAMAHYSSASPDHKSALVIEMDEKGGWTPCRLISLDGRFGARATGPQGPCRSAGWSPDGAWMYFTASVDGPSRLWRQRFPDGTPEPITSGPMEVEGVAVEKDGSIITSMGVHQSAIWIHDSGGERSLSSEGEIIGNVSPPSFGRDDSVLYYLLRREADRSGPELWRMMIESGKSEAVFPGVAMAAYDISPDGKQVVYATATPGETGRLWLAPLDRSSPARQIGDSNQIRPHFGPRGQILFQATEGNFNYLERMNPDGSGRSKVVPYPISFIQGISPGRRWVMAIVPVPQGTGIRPMAIPVDGGTPRVICAHFCAPAWSSTGRFLVIPVQEPSRTDPGRSLAIPVGPGESLPELPPGGIEPLAEASVVPGAQSIARGELVPGKDPAHFAYVNTTANRNLYRIALP
ncbi:MAG TPA: winged helix-turn-helix domain-containing protein [Bryobacteraceae bacterium]|jgi:DNA-binding winged helix-turn-helix (wHTH) protein/Tol biopolymer transport system component